MRSELLERPARDAGMLHCRGMNGSIKKEYSYAL